MSFCGEPVAPLIPLRAVSSTPHSQRDIVDVTDQRIGHVRVISPNCSGSSSKLTFTAQRTSKLFELLTRPALLFTPSLGINLPFITDQGLSTKRPPASPPKCIKRNQLIDPDPCLISVDGLVDCLFAINGLVDQVYGDFVEAAGGDAVQSPAILATNYFRKRIKPALNRLADLRIKLSDFKLGSCIGRGACGIVSLVREIAPPHSVYAMKSQYKGAWLHHDPEGAQIMLERTVLAQAAAIENPWLPHLHYAFQDDKQLHLVMDYEPGGDLYIFLSKAGHLLDSGMIQFYLAEAVEAVHSLHKMGYIHCDLKPENFAIERSGHLKLLDFGSAIRLDADGKCICPTMVGTKEYLNIELLRQRGRHSDTPLLVGPEYDYWAIGVLLYELFYGQTPFYDDDDDEMMSKIVDYKKSLKFPSGVNIPETAKQLIRSLITSPSGRLTYDDLIRHPFFKEVDFATLRESQPPYLPPVREIDDVANFSGGAARPRDETILNISTNETFSPAHNGATTSGGLGPGDDSVATVLKPISPNCEREIFRGSYSHNSSVCKQSEEGEDNESENVDPQHQSDFTTKSAKLKAIYEAAAVVTHEDIEEIEDIEWKEADCVRNLPFIGYTFTPGLVLLRHLTSGQAAAVMAAAGVGASSGTPYRSRTQALSFCTAEPTTPNMSRPSLAARRGACASQEVREYSANMIELEHQNIALQKQIDLLRTQHESQSEELRKRLIMSLDNSRVFTELNDVFSQLSNNIMEKGRTALEHLTGRIKQLYDENTQLQSLNRTSHQYQIAINRVRSTLAQLSALPNTVTETDLAELLTSLYPPVIQASNSDVEFGDVLVASSGNTPLPDVIGHELVSQLISFAVKQYKLATDRAMAGRTALEADKQELRQALDASRQQVTQLVGTLDRMFDDQQQVKEREVKLQHEVEVLKQRLDDSKQLHRDLREKCNRFEDKYYVVWDKLKEEEKKSTAFAKRLETLESLPEIVNTTVQTESQVSLNQVTTLKSDLQTMENELEEAKGALSEAKSSHESEVQHLKTQIADQKAELARLLESEKLHCSEQTLLLEQLNGAQQELRKLRDEMNGVQSENRRLVSAAAVDAQQLSDLQLKLREVHMDKDAAEAFLREANLKLDRLQDSDDHLAVISQLHRDLETSKTQLRISEQDRQAADRREASLSARISDVERELASARHDHEELFERYNRLKESTVELEAMMSSGDNVDDELTVVHRQLAESNVERRTLLDETNQLKSEVERLRVNNTQLVRQRDSAIQASREVSMSLTMERELSEVARQAFDRELIRLTTMNKQQGKLINHMYNLLAPEQRSLPLSSLSAAAGCSMLNTSSNVTPKFIADRRPEKLPSGSTQPSNSGISGPLVSSASAFFSKRRHTPSAGLPKQPSRLRKMLGKGRMTLKRKNDEGTRHLASNLPVDSDVYMTDDDFFDEDPTLADFDLVDDADDDEYHNLPRMMPSLGEVSASNCDSHNFRPPHSIGTSLDNVVVERGPPRVSMAGSITSSAPSTASSLPTSSVSNDDGSGRADGCSKPGKSSWRSRSKQRLKHVAWGDVNQSYRNVITSDSEMESGSRTDGRHKSQPKLLKQLSKILGKGKSSSAQVSDNRPQDS